MKIKIIALISMVALMYTSHVQPATPQTVDITKVGKIYVCDNPVFAQPSFNDKN